MSVIDKAKSILRYLPVRVRRGRIRRDLSLQRKRCEERIEHVRVEDIHMRTLAYMERLRVDRPLYGSYRCSDPQSVAELAVFEWSHGD